MDQHAKTYRGIAVLKSTPEMRARLRELATPDRDDLAELTAGPSAGDDEVEAVARALCAKVHGWDPDDVDHMMICGENNEPLPLWMFFEEDATVAIDHLRALDAEKRSELAGEFERLHDNAEIADAERERALQR